MAQQHNGAGGRRKRKERIEMFPETNVHFHLSRILATEEKNVRRSGSWNSGRVAYRLIQGTKKDRH